MNKAVLDACVLYPAPLRDVLLSIASVGCFVPYWSDLINDEWKRNLLKNNDKLKPEDLERTITTMNSSFQGSCLSGFEGNIGKVALPDPDDRHVVTAAIISNSSYVVTNNLKDFPRERLKPFSIIAITPDNFIEELIIKHDMLELIVAALANQRRRLKTPPVDVGDFIDTIEKQGLKKLASRLLLRTKDL